jgi:hypothetical protein
VRFILDVDQRLQPHRAQALCLLHLRTAALVEPVRGDALLGNRMHLLGADLKLDRGTQRAHQRGVQRLVAVGLRDRDVILETTGQGLEELMEHTHRHVALHLRADDDAKTEDVVDLREGQVLFAHLLVDREQCLLAAVDLHAEFGLREGLVDVVLDALDDVTPIATRLQHRLRERRLSPGSQVLERELLQLAVGLVEAEPVRDRRVDL